MAEERKPGAWERFLDQRTIPQRFLIALASIVAALGVVGGGIYAFAGWFGDSSQANDGTSIVAGGRVEQGSPAADTFVRGLLGADGQRRELDTIVSAPTGFPLGGLPPEGVIYAFLPLFYNCQGNPPGNDNCNSAELAFGDISRYWSSTSTGNGVRGGAAGHASALVSLGFFGGFVVGPLGAGLLADRVSWGAAWLIVGGLSPAPPRSAHCGPAIP